jgi:lantibiotic modifying enzyme
MKGEEKFIPNVISMLADRKLAAGHLVKIFQKDFSTFISGVSTKDPIAICSKNSKSSKRLDLYEGLGGYVYLFAKLAESPSVKLLEPVGFDKAAAVKSCQELFENIDYLLRIRKNPEPLESRISFCLGDSGVLVSCMQAALIIEDAKMFQGLFKKLMGLTNAVLSSVSDFYQEILYGIPGLLCSLLFAKKHFGDQPMPGLDDSIMACFLVIIETGLANYNALLKHHPSQLFRLVYDFCGQEYLGGVHGLLGNIYMLLQALPCIKHKLTEKQHESIHYIFRSLDLCVSRQLDNGNFPTRVTDGKSGVVQLCHGAPGAIGPLIKAAELLGTLPQEYQQLYSAEKYIESARRAGGAIWHEGVLKKGFNLCHGITGNAYAMLQLSKTHLIPPDEQRLWQDRAIHFMLLKRDANTMHIINTYDAGCRYEVGMSDYPFSLMLGLAGDLCLEIDLLDGKCTFPGYDV